MAVTQAVKNKVEIQAVYEYYNNTKYLIAICSHYEFATEVLKRAAMPVTNLLLNVLTDNTV